MTKLIEVVLNGNDRTLSVSTIETEVISNEKLKAFKLGIEVISPNGDITEYEGKDVLSVGDVSNPLPIVKLANKPVERLPEGYSWRIAEGKI